MKKVNQKGDKQAKKINKGKIKKGKGWPKKQKEKRRK